MNRVDWGALSVNLAVTLIAALVLIDVTFLIALRRRRYDTVDTFWGLGFAVVAVLGFVLSAGSGAPLTRVLVTALTVVWGVRLAVHIHRRNHGRDEDPRYAAMVRAAGGHARSRMFVRVYLLQAVLLWLISTPVQAAQYVAGGPGVAGWIGVAVWLTGFTFEALGDHQLSRFRADASNRGRVLDTGLWRYTRHPNYFGDACVWWGLYLLACHGWAGVATGFAPLLMTALLVKGTGKPMLERSMLRRRPDYADYVRRTSGFFPLPPRRSAVS